MTSNGHFDEWMLRHYDAQIMFESSVPQIRPGHGLVPHGYPRSRFTTLVQNVPDAASMREWVDKYVEAGYGGICLLGPTHPAKLYAELPEFWEEEIAYLANKSSQLLRRSRNEEAS